MEQSNFWKGFGFKTRIQPVVDAGFQSPAVRTAFRLVRSEQVALDP